MFAVMMMGLGIVLERLTAKSGVQAFGAPQILRVQLWMHSRERVSRGQ